MPSACKWAKQLDTPCAVLRFVVAVALAYPLDRAGDRDDSIGANLSGTCLGADPLRLVGVP